MKATRIDLGNGTYRYDVDGYGTVYEASKVLYTHIAIFAPVNNTLGPVTFHKSLTAAAKTSNKYWTKIGTAEIAAA